MKKLISILAAVNFISLSSYNTISCNENTNNKSYTKSSSDKQFPGGVYSIGDSLSDGGTLLAVTNSIVNDPGIDKLNVTSVVQALINSVDKAGYLTPTITKILDQFGTLGAVRNDLCEGKPLTFGVGAGSIYKTNTYEHDGIPLQGMSFSDGDTAASLLIKQSGAEMIPAFDTSIEKIHYTDGVNSADVLADSVGNNYSVAGSTAHQPSNNTNSSDSYFDDSILFQAQALIKQHGPSLKNSLVFLDIGGNDLMEESYTGNNQSDINDYLVGSKVKANDDDYINHTSNYSNVLLPDTTDQLKNIDPLSSVGQVGQALTLLKNAGAKNVIFATSPDVSIVPHMMQTHSANVLPELRTSSALYNNFATAMFSSIAGKDNPGWHTFSLWDELNKAIAEVQKQHKGATQLWTQNSINEALTPDPSSNKNGKNGKGSIINDLKNGQVNFYTHYNTSAGVTSENHNEYVFWDVVHPNGWVHQLAANDITDLFLRNKSNL